MNAPNAYAAACASRIVLDRVADKWTVLVLGVLVRRPTRFNLPDIEEPGTRRVRDTASVRNRASNGGVSDHATWRDIGREDAGIARLGRGQRRRGA